MANYGNQHNPGVTAGTITPSDNLKVSTDDVGPWDSTPRVELWGHSLILNEDDGVKCEECEMEEEMPDLMRATTGFREVVYTMYLLGKFKAEGCAPETDEIAGVPVVKPDKSAVRLDRDNLYWSGTGGASNTTVKLSVDDGEVTINGGQVLDSTSDTYAVGDVLTNKEYMEIVQENDVIDTQRIGEMTTTTTSSSKDDKKSFREKFSHLVK